MRIDAIFQHIERVQGNVPWGTVLDAGTGQHSLNWIVKLDTTRWTAVTCDESRARSVAKKLEDPPRPRDRIVGGNWMEPDFLHGEVFDVVLADYLLGSVDRYAPYFQDRLFARIRPHVGSRLYAVGLEPYPDQALTPGGQVILEIARLRDACILLANDRCYREYPMEWMIRVLERSGYRVQDTHVFPILYGPSFINGQLDVCLYKLPLIADRQLATVLEDRVKRLRDKALELYESEKGIRFGNDYFVFATAVSE